MNKIVILLLMVAAVFCAAAQSTTVTVRRTDGTTSSYTMAQSGGIYFENGTMLVRSNATTQAASENAANVGRLTFVYKSGEPEGIDGVTAQRLTLYPNPAETWVAVEGVGSEPQTVTLYNLLGRKVAEQLCSEGTRLDVSALPKGIYVVRMGVHTAKLVKR